MTPHARPVTPDDLVPRPGTLRCAGLALIAAAVLALAGCAGIQEVSVGVTTFGAWPAGRAPGSYAFERLPSQEAQGGPTQARLESAAGAALERVGFRPAVQPGQADVLVQFGVRQGKLLEPPPQFTLGIGWGVPFGHRGAFGWGWQTHPGWYGDRVADLRELGLLLLDRPTHRVLVEVQARHEGRYGGDEVLDAMFEAALQGFPDLPAGERRVTVPLPGAR